MIIKESSILVIGDIMLDYYIYGKVDRISPEAPIPVVQFIKESNVLGGCGNVIKNLSNLGLHTSVISAIGNDVDGKTIRNKLNKLGTLTTGLIDSQNIHTTRKMRIIAEHQQVVRVDWDANNLADNEYKSFKKLLITHIKNIDGIIISDYNKGVCEHSFIQLVMHESKKQGIPVFIDPKGRDWSKYSGASLITPNKKEIEEIMGYTLNSNKDFEKAWDKINSEFDINACLFTRGKDGMSYISKKEKIHQSSIECEIYDVSGAGDTVIACMAAAIMNGKEVIDSVKFANAAAGIVIGKIGTTAITKEDLDYI